MKITYRIIDGRRYNTETATRVAKFNNGLGQSDFHYVWEDLFLSPGGRWFLVGEGGALSVYAENCGNNSTCGGEQWRVLTPDEAFEWLQAHNETRALEIHFADRIQDA